MNADKLKEYLDYDPDTGIFVWKDRKNMPPNSNARQRGKIAGRNKEGYISIKINQKEYCAHQLAWMYIYGSFPSGSIDHINCNKADNRIKNLRLATVSQNGMNRAKQTNNTTGLKGVVFDKSRNKWMSKIKLNNKSINLGRFSCPAVASFAYQIASIKYHGEYGRNF